MKRRTFLQGLVVVPVHAYARPDTLPVRKPDPGEVAGPPGAGAWQRVRPFSTGGNYINFQTADEDEERVRATYGGNFGRLVEIKALYDPDNLFRANRNIRPRRLAGTAQAEARSDQPRLD